MVFRARSLEFNLEGYVISMQQELENTKPSQIMLEDREKPRKPVWRWRVAGTCGGNMTSSEQSSKRSM